MAPSASRALNPSEQKIHQACAAHDKKMLTQNEVDALVPDVNTRVTAINFLLSAGMLKIMQDDKKNISYKVVTKKEMEVKKEMGGDENMVLNHIQNSGNEGIWTKHLKAKTELHQTVINRCLKALEQKGLVKVVKSVKNPTRKIYMMSHLEPSVEVTGGPWYSENELDTEFIKMLTSACLRFIQDKSYPKSSISSDAGGSQVASTAPLFPISQATAYPTSKQIHSWLQKTKLSEQELGVEHVEMLLDVLVFDGEIERLPAYGAGMWDMGAMDVDSEEERREKKRKIKVTEEDRKKAKKKPTKKRTRKSSSEEESDEEDSRKKKKHKVKEESDDSSQEKTKASRSKKRKREDSDEESDAESSSDSGDDRKKSTRHKKSKTKSKSSRRHSSSSFELSEGSSDPSSMSRKKKKSTSPAKLSKSKKPKSIFAMDSEAENSDGMVDLGGLGSANVYRAVRQERVSLGWAQAPCGRCPVFDFCGESGPVNPKECSYYENWVQQGVADF